MGNNANQSETTEFIFNTDASTETIDPSHRKGCGVCFAKIASADNNTRCMTCGTVTCPLCVIVKTDESLNTYTTTCKPCNKEQQQLSTDSIGSNLTQIVKNHKDNGRQLLVNGYIRVLWVAHCLLNDTAFNSRVPSTDVIQCIISWLYIKESFDTANTDKRIRLTNCNQCIERVSLSSESDPDVAHAFGTSSICFPAVKIWKLQIKSMHFILGIVNENKIDTIQTFVGSVFNEHSTFGYGINIIGVASERLQVGDVIVMILELGRTIASYNDDNEDAQLRSNIGLLKYKVYRKNSNKLPLAYSIIDVKQIHVDIKNTYKLAVAMHHKDKLTLLEEWW
eukprot:181217_1